MQGIELTPEHPIEELIDMGRTAEDAGFDTLFMSCHYNNRDPFVALARTAVATDRIRLGPGVANPYETHPVALASRVATLHEASDGRAVFGVGAGDRSTLRNLGIERERPLRRVLESFRVARRLWAGDQVDHDGTFVARDAGLNYGVDGDGDGSEIPVYVGAQGPQMIRMSATHADGVLVNASHPADFEWAERQVQTGLDGRSNDRGAFDFAAYASVSVAENASAAREAARPPVAFIVGGAAPEVLDRHGIDTATAERISESIASGAFRDAFDAVTDTMLSAFCIAGTPEAVADRIDALLAHVDSVVAGAPLGPDPSEAIRLVADAFDRSRHD